MDKEEIIKRLANVDEQITKRNADISRYIARKKIDKDTVDYVLQNKDKAYRERRILFELEEHARGLEDYTLYDLCEKYKKLDESFLLRKNYQIKLDKAINDENIIQIPVLKEFLKEWKEKAYKWYLNEAHRYVELTIKYEKN